MLSPRGANEVGRGGSPLFEEAPFYSYLIGDVLLYKLVYFLGLIGWFIALILERFGRFRFGNKLGKSSIAL
jgi:hypothetical protein